MLSPVSWRRMGRGARRALVGSGVVAVSVAAVAVGQSGSRDEAPTPASDREVSQGVQPDQARSFAVFARERTRADEMPAEARRQVGNSRHSGRNIDHSRAISTPSGRGWAVPGNGAICLVVPDPVDGYGISCLDTDRAATHGLMAMLVSPSAPEVANVTMLSPRGSCVVLTKEDGAQRELRADASGVVATAIRDGVKVTVETAAGSNSLDLPRLGGPEGKGVADCGDGVYVDERAPCP